MDEDEIHRRRDDDEKCAYPVFIEGISISKEEELRVMSAVFSFIVKTDEESRWFEKEKNQEPKTGIFGCWFVELTK